MAVTGKMVGSSAKAETGEKMMLSAGDKLGLKPKFMMSQMIGKSMGGLVFAVDVSPDQIGNKYGNFSTHGTPKGYLKSGETGDQNMKIIGVQGINWNVSGGDQQIMFSMSDGSLVPTYTEMIIEYQGVQYKLVPKYDMLFGNYFNMITNVSKFTDLMMSNLGVEFQMKVIRIV